MHASCRPCFDMRGANLQADSPVEPLAESDQRHGTKFVAPSIVGFGFRKEEEEEEEREKRGREREDRAIGLVSYFNVALVRSLPQSNQSNRSKRWGIVIVGTGPILETEDSFEVLVARRYIIGGDG